MTMKMQVNTQVKRRKPNPKELARRLDRLVDRVVEKLNRKLEKKGIYLYYSGPLIDYEYDYEHNPYIEIRGVDNPEELKKLRDMIIEAIMEEAKKKIIDRYFNDDEYDLVDVCDAGYRFEYPTMTV